MLSKRIFHLLLLLPLTLAQLQQPFPPEIPARHNILSAASPIAEALSTKPTNTAATDLRNLIHTLSHTIDARITNNDTLACNIRAVPWLALQQKDLQVRQIGLLDRTCQSRLVASEAQAREQLPPHFFETARAALRDGATALAEAAEDFVKRQQALQWRAAYAVRGWDVMKRAQTCNLETATAYRVNGVWYLRAVVTNHPVDAFQPDWQRQYVEEFVAPDFGPALRVVHPQFPDGELVNGTTLLIRHGGKAAFSTVRMGDAENPALVEALRRNELAVDQARDAITTSNIAILALPLVMSVIPVAFLAELNTCATLLYIVFTDVFSALPFLIKGIELTSAGIINRGEVVAYHIGTSQLGVLEVWAAECHGEDSFRNLGIVFIVIAIGTIVIGIGFEIFAWKWMKRKGRLGKGPFGEVIRVNQYTVLERTVDEFDGEHIVAEGRRRWRIRWKGPMTVQQGIDDFVEPE